jgi:uncharacterized protein (TIGR02996 family)
MNDRHAFISAICANPDDDAPRLQFADWLDEQASENSGYIDNNGGWIVQGNGYAQRAEFIRVQIELVGMGWVNDSPSLAWGPSAERFNRRLADGRKRREELRTRERELLIGSPKIWGANASFSDFLSGLGYTWPLSPSNLTWEFTRGFVESITCTLADWLTHGPAIIREHPLTRVEISDRRAMEFTRQDDPAEWGFAINDFEPRASHRIPELLDEFMIGRRSSGNRIVYYPMPVAASQALSLACLAYAKAQSRELASV